MLTRRLDDFIIGSYTARPASNGTSTFEGAVSIANEFLISFPEFPNLNIDPNALGEVFLTQSTQDLARTASAFLKLRAIAFALRLIRARQIVPPDNALGGSFSERT